MRFTALLLVVLPASSTVAAVKSVKRERPLCQVLEAGNYQAIQRTTHPDPSSPTGDRFESDDVEFTSQTRTIARTLDTGFGFRYQLNVPANTSVKVTLRIAYPRAINGKKSWENFDDWGTGNGTLVQHMGYTFTEAYEMVPGAWAMQVLVDDKPGCAVTFTVK